MGIIDRSLESRRDAFNIWLHIAENNVDAADALIEQFNGALRLLATQPQMGEARPALGELARIFPVGFYLLIYEPIEGGIQLLRIIHGARHLPSAMYN